MKYNFTKKKYCIYSDFRKKKNLRICQKLQKICENRIFVKKFCEN